MMTVETFEQLQKDIKIENQLIAHREYCKQKMLEIRGIRGLGYRIHKAEEQFWKRKYWEACQRTKHLAIYRP